MLNRMSLQLLRQWVTKVFTNPFPVPSMPDSLTDALKAAEEGKIQLHPPVEPKGYFRGRIDYDKERCIGCKLCVRVCPANAITYLEDEKKIQIHVDRCCFCAQCTEICPVKCLTESDAFLLSSYDRKAQVVVDSGTKKKEDEVEETPVKYEVDEEKCIGCTKCARNCPVNAISGELKKPHVIDKDKCVGCGKCAELCPKQAIHQAEASSAPVTPKEEKKVEEKPTEKPAEKIAEKPAEKQEAAPQKEAAESKKGSKKNGGKNGNKNGNKKKNGNGNNKKNGKKK
ncbi:MAG: 4Fe-4S binding protein [Aminobacterium sp.]|jgi:electron transport complex protein RnfB|uniref:4Fe-4S binding protein n=1 Tax=Aminobacterium sp. TaxID=1872491 RepID=UPI001BCC64C1|nr:4Fe-4S binding protein [Aminobacterium sp.]MDD2206801.1 4Fe-4S binding protein [Aminobacterium sp.]MDD3426122.1 4Fe-4S binding protein [Aminobacterium sp.]MDD3707281.1 4Fe-4S binding protein [Aminobacterium sp.]MDD4228553.1 4Fe-4S binding protein [Aminobacterium sp.]MDD4551471.1 4Fe-4S binding protein [Aminobacterium sp.]